MSCRRFTTPIARPGHEGARRGLADVFIPVAIGVVALFFTSLFNTLPRGVRAARRFGFALSEAPEQRACPIFAMEDNDQVVERFTRMLRDAEFE